MFRQTILKAGQPPHFMVTSLFRQLHLGNSGERLGISDVPSSLGALYQFQNAPRALNSSNGAIKLKSPLSMPVSSSTPLLAQARQEIVENPFQYIIRPSIGIPPEMTRRPEYRTPVSHSTITPLEIPTSRGNEDKEIKDGPASSTPLEKQAARLIVIRRSKMNKHKLRKLRKKMKYVWAKVRLRRAIRKEKRYLNSKMELINAAKSFDAKEYVAGIIKRAKEEPLPRRWNDPLMPEWYKEQEMKKEAWQKRYQKMINLYVNKSITIDFTDKKK